MIVLYNVVPCPTWSYPETGIPGIHISGHPSRERWWNTQGAAEAAAEKLCRAVGERPKPGIQHTRPIPVGVFACEFDTVLDVVRCEPTIRREVSRIWQVPQAPYWTDMDPSEAEARS